MWRPVVGLVVADERISVSPTNIVDAAEMTVLAADAADAAGVLGGKIRTSIDPSNINCPDETAVLANDQMQYEITDERWCSGCARLAHARRADAIRTGLSALTTTRSSSMLTGTPRPSASVSVHPS